MIRLADQPGDVSHFLSIRRSFGLSAASSAQKFETYLDDLEDVEGRACFLSLDEKGRPIGYVQLVWDGEEAGSGLLHDLRIKSVFQSRGFGQELVAHLESEALARGFFRLRLWVDSTNERARSFYRRLGYETTGAQDGEGGLLMVKVLCLPANDHSARTSGAASCSRAAET